MKSVSVGTAFHTGLQGFTRTNKMKGKSGYGQFSLQELEPGKLGAKPDALTRRWDIYPKEGSSDYAAVNPHNLCPIFTDDQILLTSE